LAIQWLRLCSANGLRLISVMRLAFKWQNSLSVPTETVENQLVAESAGLIAEINFYY